ncbi:MAG: hypothetical protein J6L83_04135 [Clostridia bacterium]|nr:hypothetical protein [Clostridia bacterium]
MLVEQKKCNNCGGTLTYSGNGKWQCIYCKTVYLENSHKKASTEDKAISVDKVYDYIEILKKDAVEKGNNSIILRSGDIHKDLGLKNRMPTVCGAMRKAMGDRDIIRHQTPSGNSSTLLIEYFVKE